MSAVLDFSLEQKDEFSEAFYNFADEQGTLDVKGLGELFSELGEELTEQEVQAILDTVDIDGSGVVNCVEFIELMRNRLLVDPVVEEEMQSAFNLLDKDGSGTISSEEIIDVVVDFCKKLTEEEVMEIIEWSDIDKNGVIDYGEFCEIIKQRTVAEMQRARFLEEAELVLKEEGS